MSGHRIRSLRCRGIFKRTPYLADLKPGAVSCQGHVGGGGMPILMRTLLMAVISMATV